MESATESPTKGYNRDLFGYGHTSEAIATEATILSSTDCYGPATDDLPSYGHLRKPTEPYGEFSLTPCPLMPADPVPPLQTFSRAPP